MKIQYGLKVTMLFAALMMAVPAAAIEGKVVQNVSPKSSIDDTVVKFLGRQRIAVLFAADTVETYKIDWRKRSEQKAKHIYGYPVISKGRNLEDLEIRIVRALVAQGKSYDFIVSKRTRLRPDYMLRFINNSTVVDIVLDLQSNQWGFYFKDAPVREDITENLASPVLMMILRAVFGNSS